MLWGRRINVDDAIRYYVASVITAANCYRVSRQTELYIKADRAAFLQYEPENVRGEIED